MLEGRRAQLLISIQLTLITIQQIVEDVRLPFPPGGVRGRPTARLRGRLFLVPRTKDGSDKGEELLHIVVELARQTDHTPARLTPGLLRGRPQHVTITLHLRRQRLAEVDGLVPPPARRQTVRRHGSVRTSAVYLRVLRQTRSRLNHCYITITLTHLHIRVNYFVSQA